jgi:hypothetical protein
MLGIHRATFWRNFVRTGRVKFIAGTRRIAETEIDRILNTTNEQPKEEAK